jgi:hypothetical protein
VRASSARGPRQFTEVVLLCQARTIISIIAILAGLAAVEKGTASLSDGMRVSWDRKDRTVQQVAAAISPQGPCLHGLQAALGAYIRA